MSRSVTKVIVAAFLAFSCLLFPHEARAEMTEYPVAKLQFLDKTTARTMTFDARVGSTVKFGHLYIRVQTCRKAPPIEKPEAAAFLQIWEVLPKEETPQWVFSGWMYASSPALSPMDHPVYDVWVLDCLEKATGGVPGQELEEAPEEASEKAAEQSSEQPPKKSPEKAGPVAAVTDPETQTADLPESAVE